MKKIIVIIAIGISSVSMSFATKPITLANEIKQKVFTNLKSNEKEKFNKNYVIVNFKIIDGKIKVSEINSSSLQMKNFIINKLNQIKINSNYEENKTYKYKFTS